MNKNNKAKRSVIAYGGVFGVLLAINFLIPTSPALAHHAMGGEIPSNFTEGLISGLAHPVIGIDHLAFVIAIGFLAALSQRFGMIVPLVFMFTTAIGTIIHLQSIDLPVVELIVSASVLIIGILLAKTNQTNLVLLTVIGAIAGIFHGYAYGESIVGAETLAIGAYLLGFCLIQLAISAIAFYLGKTILKKPTLTSHLPLRFAGFTIAGIGFAFLSRTILG
jgi:urease accessory protein